MFLLHSLLKKLNYKDSSPILILNSPTEFSPFLKEIKPNLSVLEKMPSKAPISFALIFLYAQKEISTYISILDILEPDGVLWFAYPKKSSKKNKSDLNRDVGWDLLPAHDFLAVRQIAIDEDWSALRFRNKKYIKSITRKE